MTKTPDAHTGRRTQGVTGAALGAVAKLGGKGPQNVGAAQGNEEMGKVDGGRPALRAPWKMVVVSKRVLRLAQHMADGRQIHIEGTAGLEHWRGQKIPEGCAFLATDADTGSGLAFLSVEEKEQWDAWTPWPRIDLISESQADGKGVAA